MSDQDSGAIGRLNDDDIALLEACDISFIRTNVSGKWQKVLTNGAAEAIERIIREHTDRALAEVEQRIDQCGVRNDSAERWGITTALHIVRDYRAARQEKGR